MHYDKVAQVAMALVMIVIGFQLLGVSYVLLHWITVGIRINNTEELDGWGFLNIACTSAFWPFQIKQLVREFNA